MITLKLFTTTYCSPCKQIRKGLIKILNERPGIQPELEVIDITNTNQEAMKYKVTSVPTLLVCKDDVPMIQLTGNVDKYKIIQALDKMQNDE